MTFLLAEDRIWPKVLRMSSSSSHAHRLLAILSLIAASSGSGAILAFTNFDTSTASGNTKSDLNWTLNGLEDPGSLSASQFEGGAVNIFDANAFVQDIFIPGIIFGGPDQLDRNPSYRSGGWSRRDNHLRI